MDSKQFVKTLLVFGVLVLFAAACIQQAQRSAVTLTSADTPDAAPARVSSKTFKDFSHSIPEHTQFECNTCHQREAGGVKSQLGGHESCIGCHMNEWIDQEQMICSVCHTNVESTDPPVKAFPVKFIEGFNMRFDHAKHSDGPGKPAAGCVACHNSSGRGKTIPYGFEAHADCYGCHTRENKLGQCSVCHQLAPYNRTTQSDYNFKAIFSHGGGHAAIDCARCHKVVNGAPNSQQVTKIAILEHRTTPGNNCLKCHNGRDAFSGNVQGERTCVRCHGGASFATLPSGTYTGVAEEAPAED